MACPICDRLTSELAVLIRKHILALKSVDLAEESGIAKDYMDRSEECSDAELSRDLARLDLEMHKRIHRATAA